MIRVENINKLTETSAKRFARRYMRMDTSLAINTPRHSIQLLQRQQPHSQFLAHREQ